jgi:hypothetical protein
MTAPTPVPDGSVQLADAWRERDPSDPADLQAIDLTHQLPHELGWMAGRHEVVNRGRQQPDLAHIPRSRGRAHVCR